LSPHVFWGSIHYIVQPPFWTVKSQLMLLDSPFNCFVLLEAPTVPPLAHLCDAQSFGIAMSAILVQVKNPKSK